MALGKKRVLQSERKVKLSKERREARYAGIDKSKIGLKLVIVTMFDIYFNSILKRK